MCVRQWLISDNHLSLAVFLVGSRNYLQLQHFTHFMITAEAFNPATNRESIAGPKRVGRFQLFGDALTKFYEMCVNTVSEADDLPKTEVQVRTDYVCVCVRLFTTFGFRVMSVYNLERQQRKLRRRRSKSFSVRSFSSDWQFRAQLNSIIYENKDLFVFHLFHPQQPPRVMFRFSPLPPTRQDISMWKHFSFRHLIAFLLFCYCLRYTRAIFRIFIAALWHRNFVFALMKIQFANCLCSRASEWLRKTLNEFPARFAHFAENREKVYLQVEEGSWEVVFLFNENFSHRRDCVGVRGNLRGILSIGVTIWIHDKPAEKKTFNCAGRGDPDGAVILILRNEILGIAWDLRFLEITRKNSWKLHKNSFKNLSMNGIILFFLLQIW